MQFSERKSVIVALIFGLVLLLAMRLFRLPETLLFYNDMGRDYLVLQNWLEEGKPPLLGPQTSALSYNQSAWYFYVLFPLFLLSNGSAFASTATLVLVAIVCISLSAWINRRDHRFLWLLAIVTVIFAIHPQAVLQNRFIWNPSFVPYFLILSLSVLHALRSIDLQKLELRNAVVWLLLGWLPLAAAVGFSYSVLPAAVLIACAYLFVTRKRLPLSIAAGFVSAGIILLPLLAFEIRHSFALTELLFIGQRGNPTSLSLEDKFHRLLILFFPPSAVISSAVQLLLLGLATLYSVVQMRAKNVLIILFPIAVFFALWLLPVNPEKHYIFGVLVAIAWLIGSLEKKVSVPLVIFFAVAWLSPSNTELYLQTPPRTVADMQRCYQSVCSKRSEPAYASQESGILAGYHNALEHQFFLKKAGCTVYDIVEHQDQASTMFVINDSGSFDPGKSGYNELTLFGPYTVAEKTTCTDKLSVVTIEKATDQSTTEVFQPQ